MSQYQNSVSFQAPTDFNMEQAAVERQRKLAEAMMMRGQQPQPGGAMVSGHYVPQSWTQGLANALQGPAGMYAARQADEQSKDIAARQRKAYVEELTKFGELANGTPAQPEAQGNNPSAFTPGSAAQPGDRRAALAMALGAQNPALQKYGMDNLMPKAPEWALGERFNQQTGQPEKFMYDKNNPAIQQAIGGQQAVKGTAVNGQLVNPATGAPIGNAIPKQLDPDSVVAMGPGGTLMPNAAVIAAKSQVAAAGKPQISVDARNFNTQESEQSKAYGKTLGEMRGNITQAGFDAPKKIAQLDRMEELLKGVDGGAAAPAIADLASAANSLGIKLDPKLGNKQAAEALAIGMAGAMRQPGTGPMTDKDMDNFIRQVPGLAKTAEGRAQITKTMRASIERDQRAAKFASEYARKNGGVIDDNYMDAIADFYAKNPVVTPSMPAANARGKAFSDPGKEQRYQEWLRSQAK